MGPDGVYVARPKSDGGWHASPTVKAGSMFANPFRIGEGEGKYSNEESMRRFREYTIARAAPSATTAAVIKLLPPATQTLARKRYVGGAVREGEGKSVAHLRLDIVGSVFWAELQKLRGKRLGCWCNVADPLCHAKILAELAETLPEYPNEAWTITWGDVAMNEVEMQRIGQLAEGGVPVARLQEIKAQLEAEGMHCVLIDLRVLLPEGQRGSAPEAAVLVVRGGISPLSEDPQGEDKLLAEQRSMPIDKQAYDGKHGGVFNKHNRYNNLLGDDDLAADYANKKGTVVNCEATSESGLKYPITSRLRAVFTALLLAPRPLVGETNQYFKASECGIGWHGDRERMMVVGVRLGPGAARMPLKFLWFEESKPVGAEGEMLLDAGDVYFMSEKAVGFDWLTKKGLTLRHSAGADKYSSVDTLKAIKGGKVDPPSSVRLYQTTPESVQVAQGSEAEGSGEEDEDDADEAEDDGDGGNDGDDGEDDDTDEDEDEGELALARKKIKQLEGRVERRDKRIKFAHEQFDKLKTKVKTLEKENKTLKAAASPSAVVLRCADGDQVLEFRPFQKEIIETVTQHPANGRTILWCYSLIGGVGKSKVADLLVSKYDAVIIRETAEVDAKDLIRRKKEEDGLFEARPIIIVDLPMAKSAAAQTNKLYAVLESIMGTFHSNKRDGAVVCWGEGKKPHVIVFANDSPDPDRFAADRLDVSLVTEAYTLKKCQWFEKRLAAFQAERQELQQQEEAAADSGEPPARLLTKRGSRGGAGGSGVISPEKKVEAVKMITEQLVDTGRLKPSKGNKLPLRSTQMCVVSELSDAVLLLLGAEDPAQARKAATCNNVRWLKAFKANLESCLTDSDGAIPGAKIEETEGSDLGRGRFKGKYLADYKLSAPSKTAGKRKRGS